MNIKSLASILALTVTALSTLLTSVSANATGTVGTSEFDAYCARQPAGSALPQQSRPYRASGNSCALCHTNGNTSQFNTLGTATRTCTTTSCPSSVNAFCANAAPTGTPSITAPAAGSSVNAGTAVTFSATGGTDPDGFPLRYNWTFTNGIPPATGASVTVTPTAAGTLTATLEVSDANGAAIATRPTRSVTVTTVAANQPPNGSIAAPSNVVQGVAASFQGSASDPNGDTVTYLWNFGANATPASSTAQNPSVTFTTTGARTVTLSVTDSRGLADPTPATVSVTVAAPSTTNQAPNGTITLPANIVQGQSVTLQGAGTDPNGDAVTYLWNFGANASPATSTVQNPTVTFSTVGSRTVTLVVTDSRGLADPTPASATVTVVAAPPPPPAACTDADRDGFFAQGGICGPRDCNDANAAVNPGATERCGDGIDNDCDGAIDSADKECNGTDCLARFFAKPVVITEARWARDDGAFELDVEGNLADPGAAVSLFNAATGALLGTTTADSIGDDIGEWEFELRMTTPPCRVRVEINGQMAEASVANAPSNCVGAPAPGPVANADSYSTPTGSTLTVAAPGVLRNDTVSAGKTLSAILVSNPASGSLSLAANGGFNFTPAAGFTGPVSFTYRASDGTASSAPATVTITVAPAQNRAPNGTITPPVQAFVGQPANFQGSATDPDGDNVSYLWNFGANASPATSTAQNPAVTFSTAGTRTVTLSVTDSRGLADPTPATAQVSVAAANRPPEGTILSPSGNLTVERGQRVSFRAIGSDPDGNIPLTYSWDFGGGATNSSLQSLRVRFGRTGTFTVRLTVRDSQGLADPTPATLTVRVVEDDD